MLNIIKYLVLHIMFTYQTKKEVILILVLMLISRNIFLLAIIKEKNINSESDICSKLAIEFFLSSSVYMNFDSSSSLFVSTPIISLLWWSKVIGEVLIFLKKKF